MMMIINRIFALILIIVLGLSGQVQATQAPAGMDVEYWEYLYDANGNITDRLNSTSFTQFDYDVLNRLTGEMGQEDSSYQYDDVGNRLEKSTESVVENYHYSPTSNRLEQVGSDNRTFDDTGNTVSDRNGQRVFTYNTAGRLHQVHENGVLLATYDYDAHGRRTRKATPDGVVIYIYGPGGELLGEYDETGQPVREYIHLNGAPLVQINGMLTEETITYLHADHLGTPRRGTDGTGEVVWSWESDAFGSTPANDDPDADGHKMVVNLRFPGQYFDKETGLHYNWHRDYDPTLGRYIQSDPIGLAGGINTYTYVLNNPLIYTDPTGENPVQGAAHGGRTGAQIGGAMGGLPGAVAGGILGAGLGAGIGWWAGDQIRDQFNDDASDDAGDDAAREQCENDCDLEWDRNRAMCKADAAMRGYNSNRFRQCMNEVQRIHIECIQDCAKDCKE